MSAPRPRDSVDLIAIEGGGTRSRGWRVWISGERVRVKARAQAGPANLQRVGVAGLASVLGTLRDALYPAGERPTTMALGLAGVSTAGDRSAALEALAAAGFTGRALVVSDAQAALRGALGREAGVLLIAGTGAIAMGWSKDTGWVRAGGWGPLLGDEGSALDLARRAMADVRMALDGRMGSGSIQYRMMRRLRLSSDEALAAWLRRASSALAPAAVAQVAQLSEDVLASAGDGDARAQEHVAAAAAALAGECEAVARRLGLSGGPVVLHGGLAIGSGVYREALARALLCRGLTRVRLATRDVALDGLVALAGDGDTPTYSVGAGAVSMTESANPRTADIDLATPQDLVDLMLDEDAGVPQAVRACRVPIARAVEAIVKAFATRRAVGAPGRGRVESARKAARVRPYPTGRLIYIGAGTSGRLGVLDASECPPTFSTEAGQVVGIIAGGDRALRHAAEGAEDEPRGGRLAVDRLQVGGVDVVVGISASGRTPYVGGALDRARELGATTVLVCCNPAAQLAPRASIVIAPVVGPEIVQGSTRLKAGTATKLVLNMLSTASLALSGKVFSNRMVDLRPGSHKLLERGVRILSELLGVDADRARELFAASGRRVKVALVMGRRGVSRQNAERALERAGGFIRRALDEDSSRGSRLRRPAPGAGRR